MASRVPHDTRLSSPVCEGQKENTAFCEGPKPCLHPSPPPPRLVTKQGAELGGLGGPGRSELASAPSAVSRVRTSFGSSAVFRPVPARASATGFQFVCVLSCWQFPPVFHQQDSGIAEVSEPASFSPHGSGMASRRACSAHTAFCVFSHLRLWEPNISSSGQQPCDPRPTRNNAAVRRARRAPAALQPLRWPGGVDSAPKRSC